MQDDRRPWIRKEEKTFTDLLRRLGAQVTRHLHYDSQTANLMTHFEVLQAFCQHIHNQNQQQQQQQQLHSQQQLQQEQLTQQILNNAQNNDQQHPQPQSQTSEEK